MEGHSFFLTEDMWVLDNFASDLLVIGLLISCVVVAIFSRSQNPFVRYIGLGISTIILWGFLFAGVDYGYREWQGIDNPPDDAFSDTGGPFAFLFLGWMPALCILYPFLWLLGKLKKEKSYSWRKPL